MTPEYESKFGAVDSRIPLDEKDAQETHIQNFLDCIHSRQKPTLNVDIAARAQVLISMAVQSYREGRVLYFDEKNWKVSNKPSKS